MSMRMTTLAMAMTVGWFSAVSAQPASRDLTVQPSKRYNQGVPGGRLSLRAELDRPDRSYQIGDALVLRVKVNEPAFVYVVNFGSSGATKVVFPNALHGANRLQPGLWAPLPGPDDAFRLCVNGPTGLEMVRVVAAPGPLGPLALESLTRTGDVRDGSRPRMRDLTVEMKRDPKLDVAVVDLEYSVSHGEGRGCALENSARLNLK